MIRDHQARWKDEYCSLINQPSCFQGDNYLLLCWHRPHPRGSCDILPLAMGHSSEGIIARFSTTLRSFALWVSVVVPSRSACAARGFAQPLQPLALGSKVARGAGDHALCG